MAKAEGKDRKDKKTVGGVAPGSAEHPPKASPPDADEVRAAFLELLSQRPSPGPFAPILLTGVPERVAEALAVASPDGLSAAAAEKILTLTPSASVVLGVPAQVAEALAVASPPGILPQKTFDTLVKLSPPVQALQGISPQTALLLAVISPDGMSEQTLKALQGLEPAAKGLRAAPGVG